jgi:hypothetical protein
MLIQDAVSASDHRTFSMDLDVESYFGYETDAIPAKQLRQLQLKAAQTFHESHRIQMHHKDRCKEQVEGMVNRG